MIQKITSKTTFVLYGEQIKKKKIKKLDQRSYMKIFNLWLRFVVDRVLSGYKFYMPYKLGVLQIVGKKRKATYDENGRIKGLIPDWKSTKDLWANDEEARKNKQLVYFTNIDTNGIGYKFAWWKKGSPYLMKTIYEFKPSTNIKKRMRDNIKTHSAEYEIIK